MNYYMIPKRFSICPLDQDANLKTNHLLIGQYPDILSFYCNYKTAQLYTRLNTASIQYFSFS